MSGEPGTSGPIHELRVDYDPGGLATTVARRRQLFRGRLVSLAISALIVTVLLVWQPAALGGAGIGVVSVLLITASVVWALIYLLRYRRARAELASIGVGVALRIGRPGVEVAGLTAAWPEVDRLGVVKRRLGAAPGLELVRLDGQRALLPLDQVSVFPATLDSAARVFSGGRRGVDLAALDL